MLILSGSEIDQCLPMADAITGMKQAFAAASSGAADMPNRTVIPVGVFFFIGIFWFVFYVLFYIILPVDRPLILYLSYADVVYM